MKLAIVGSTGLVGREIIKVLEERNFKYSKIILVASEKSVGMKQLVNLKNITIVGLKEMLLQNPDIALFSAGSKVSKTWAPRLVEQGCKVIDNSSYWRMSLTQK